MMACASTSTGASRATLIETDAPLGLAASLERFVNLQSKKNWSEVAKMLAPSYLASTSQTAEAVVLDGVHPLIRLKVRHINAPGPELSGLWSLFGCAEFEASGLNPKYEVQLIAEKVEEGWKFWFPEALLDCMHCPVRPCRL
jgi:hypothetical protein